MAINQAEQPAGPQLPDARPLRAAGLSSIDAVGSPSATAGAGRTDGRALILAVERDPHVRALEAYFLYEAGYAVEFAADGIAALEMARSLAPEIIITEILVPKLDGLALCRAVKKDPLLRRTAVLVFSILAAEGRAREAGADAFLMKPLADQRLVETVRALLASRSTPLGTPSGVPAPASGPQS